MTSRHPWGPDPLGSKSHPCSSGSDGGGEMTTRSLTPDEIREFVVVAQRHGTTVAAAWSGIIDSTARNIRVAHDPSYRPRRGHPTAAQVRDAAPRHWCPCARCISHFRIQAIRERQDATTIRSVPAGTTGEWWDDAACRGHKIDHWFPDISHLGRPRGDGTGDPWENARAICQACPVAEPCLAYALEHQLTDGMFGGLTPRERRGTPRRPLTSAPSEARTRPIDGDELARRYGGTSR